MANLRSISLSAVPLLSFLLLACGSDPNTVIPKTAEKAFLSLLKSKYLRLYIQEETGINLLMLAAGLVSCGGSTSATSTASTSGSGGTGGSGGGNSVSMHVAVMAQSSGTAAVNLGTVTITAQ